MTEQEKLDIPQQETFNQSEITEKGIEEQF